jgi:chitin disaccharide deacetylase
MTLLLIHADDFGLTEGVTRGIVHAIHEGIVTATSAMVCAPRHFERVQAHCNGLGGRIGLHLQLTDGRPVLAAAEVPSLVDENGCFARHRSQIGAINPEELFSEWLAQLARFRTLDFEPSHLDTHHSVHVLPVALEVYKQLARDTDLPVRGSENGLNSELRHCGLMAATRYTFLTETMNRSPVALRRALAVYRRLDLSDENSLEIGCHPGFVDGELAATSRYIEPRALELELLCSAELRQYIDELGYELAEPARLRRAGQSTI